MGEGGIGTWPMDDLKAHIGFMKRFSQELSQAVPRLHDPERNAGAVCPSPPP